MIPDLPLVGVAVASSWLNVTVTLLAVGAASATVGVVVDGAIVSIFKIVVDAVPPSFNPSDNLAYTTWFWAVAVWVPVCFPDAVVPFCHLPSFPNFVCNVRVDPLALVIDVVAVTFTFPFVQLFGSSVNVIFPCDCVTAPVFAFPIVDNWLFPALSVTWLWK